MSNRTVAIAAGTIAVLIAAGLAYLGYAAAQKRSQQKRVSELVVDTTAKLREVLVAKRVPDLVAPLDANLNEAKAPRDPKFADAAEQYIISAREIARRRAEIERLERRAAESRQALAAHMARASHRGTGWLDQAVALKKRVEDDHFNLGVELKALDQLLFSLPEAEQALAPHVARDSLIEETLRVSARQQAQDDLRRATDDLQHARRLNVR
jgi:hypothetical protein